MVPSGLRIMNKMVVQAAALQVAWLASQEVVLIPMCFLKVDHDVVGIMS